MRFSYAKNAHVKDRGKYQIEASVKGTPVEFYLEFENRPEIEAAYQRSYDEGVRTYMAESQRLQALARQRLEREFKEWQKKTR